MKTRVERIDKSLRKRTERLQQKYERLSYETGDEVDEFYDSANAYDFTEGGIRLAQEQGAFDYLGTGGVYLDEEQGAFDVVG